MKFSEFILRHRWRIALAIVVLAAVVWLVVENRQALSREAIVEYGESLPAVWLVVAAFVLPLVGFPVSIVLLLLGIRFGFWQGLLWAAMGMAFHHLIAYWVVHGHLRDRLHRKLESWDYKVPKIGDRHPTLFTMVFAAVHGPPYTLKLYLLALTEVPLRIYFWVGWPVYLVFAPIAVGAGSAVMDFDPTWIYVLIAAMTALALIGRWLRKKYGGGEGGGRTLSRRGRRGGEGE